MLLSSARDHGLKAADRLIGSVSVPRLDGIRAHPMRLVRRRVVPAQRVATPRHLIVYRQAADGVVEILGIVHDRMVLSRAARKIVRVTDKR